MREIGKCHVTRITRYNIVQFATHVSLSQYSKYAYMNKGDCLERILASILRQLVPKANLRRW